jgi:hypothetical protein
MAREFVTFALRQGIFHANRKFNCSEMVTHEERIKPPKEPLYAVEIFLESTLLRMDLLHNNRGKPEPLIRRCRSRGWSLLRTTCTTSKK